MGLDNGIYIKKINRYNIPSFIKYDNLGDDIEIAYWRKCWGIRYTILDKLHLPINGAGTYKLDIEDIPAVIKILKSFFSKEYWEDNADSIWEFDEYFDNMLQIMINLKWLVDYMKEDSDIEVYFYDSY